MNPPLPSGGPVDVLIRDALVLTLDAERRILRDGALAFRDGVIVAVGKTADIAPAIQPREVVDGRGFLVAPGLVNGHVHVTGEPLTRGFVPDDTGWSSNVFEWLVPLYQAQNEADERLAAQLAAAELLRNGVTSFIEAGTIRHLDAAVDGLREVGIRGRVAQWAQDRAFSPEEDQTALTDRTVKLMQAEMERFPDDGGLISAWPSLVGHMTATDALWVEAARLAKAYGAGISAHMSPVEADPTGTWRTPGDGPSSTWPNSASLDLGSA